MDFAEEGCLIKRFGRAALGVPIGIISGLILLFVVNSIFSSISPPVGVGELFEQALREENWSDRIFAWAMLYGLFVAPIIRGIKEGYSENYSMVGHTLLPFVVGVIAVFIMFIIAYVISFITAFINLIFDADSIIGIFAIIALFIAFCTPVTKVILIIFD